MVAVIAMFGAPPARAHTEVQSASPGPAQEITGVIDEIVLTFLDEIAPGATIEVSGPSGRDLSSTAPVLDGRVLRAAIEPVDEVGDYVVRYSFTALDGDDQDESYRFRIVEAESTALPAGAVIATVGALGAIAGAVVRRRDHVQAA